MESLHSVLRSLALFGRAVKACGFETTGSVDNDAYPCDFESTNDFASDYYGRTYRDTPQTIIKVNAYTPLGKLDLLPQKLAKFFWDRYPYAVQPREEKPFLLEPLKSRQISWPCIFRGDHDIRVLLLDLVPIYQSSETELILAFPFDDNPVVIEDNGVFAVTHRRSAMAEVVAQRVAEPAWTYNIIKEFPTPEGLPLGKVYDIEFKKPWIRLSQDEVSTSVNWVLERAIADLQTVLGTIGAERLIADLVAQELANLAD